MTLFASGNSVTSARLVSCATTALRLDPHVRDTIPYYMLMLDRVRECADDFDILHFHIDQFHFPLFRPIANSTLTTLHGRQDLRICGRFFSASLTCRWSQSRITSVCQFTTLISLPRCITGCQSICSARHLIREAGGYLAFLGRISPEKGVDRAIKVAQTLLASRSKSPRRSIGSTRPIFASESSLDQKAGACNLSVKSMSVRKSIFWVRRRP